MNQAEEELWNEFNALMDYINEAFFSTREVGYPEDIYPPDEEMINMGYHKDDNGVWFNPNYVPPKEETSELPF